MFGLQGRRVLPQQAVARGGLFSRNKKQQAGLGAGAGAGTVRGRAGGRLGKPTQGSGGRKSHKLNLLVLIWVPGGPHNAKNKASGPAMVANMLM